jgi:AraC-like DNA-binding protein
MSVEPNETDRIRLTLPAASGIAVYPPGATFGPRRMRDFEFVWMIEGDAEYRWRDRIAEAPAGSILLCRPGAVDFFRWDPLRRTRHGYFHFNLLDYPPRWPEPERWPLVRTPREEDILRPLFRHLLAWIGSGDPLQCRLALATLLAAYVSGEVRAGDALREAWPDAVERAWARIEKRVEETPSEALSLAELAEAACVTPEHLCRLFKSATGRTPLEAARLARLDRSAALLCRSNYSIREIAELCGFASPFHFSRRFKEAYGQSPSGLRQAVRAGGVPPAPLRLRLRKAGSS